MLPATAAADADSAPRGDDESVAVIDLRAGEAIARRADRARIATALSSAAGVQPLADGALAAALAGEYLDRSEAEDRLALAKAAFGDLDCSSAISVAAEATVLWAAVQARGAAVTGELRQALLYQFLCGDQHGDFELANRAARSLRRLDPGPPPGVPADRWQRYPELDATSNRKQAELHVSTVPSAAEVYVDFSRVGQSPTVVYLAEGPHVIAAGRGEASASREIALSGNQELELTLRDEGHVSELRARIRTLRRSPEQADAAVVGELLEAAGVRGAIVLREERLLEAWGKTPRGAGGLALGVVSSPTEASELVLDHILASAAAEQTSRPPLLREEDAPKSDNHRQKWWVYAAVAGAAIVGGAVILANELAEDRQRFEVTIP